MGNTRALYRRVCVEDNGGGGEEDAWYVGSDKRIMTTIRRRMHVMDRRGLEIGIVVVVVVIVIIIVGRPKLQRCRSRMSVVDVVFFLCSLLVFLG